MNALRPLRALDPDEQRRLDECVLEPIRSLGTIQRHGVLLGLHPISHSIELASDNLDELFGMPAAAAIGRSLDEVAGFALLTDVLGVLAGPPAVGNPLPAAIGQRQFDVLVHRGAGHIFVEFEPSLEVAAQQAPAALYEAMHRLSRVTSVASLWRDAVRELGVLTGFDRVMIYRFHDDGHGEIVAEQVVDEMEPYLGLHYPASDIPAQARELYLTKLSRAIVSTNDDAVALVAKSGSDEIDLSLAELRSVSPHHLHFMRNMGQASTLSLSLIHDGVLIGMITCAHRTQHRLPYMLRRGLEIFANQIALQANSIEEIDRLTRQAGVGAIRAGLAAQVVDSDDMAAALLRGALTVLDLIPADGATLRLAGVESSIGTVPDAAHTSSFVAALGSDDSSFATDALPIEHPALAAMLPDVAGVLLLPIGVAGDFLVFFRREVASTVSWLGDMRSANRASTLSPRTSFSSWTASVSGTAPAWGDLVGVASELGRDLDGAMLQRAESKLAGLALRDPLTSLPNRRLLMDRLDLALARRARGEPLAVLFVDLDGFKSINDTAGHDAGDELLILMADRIVATTRSDDTVARLGGDEFIVVCENTTDDDANHLADRLVATLRGSASIAGENFVVTASVGIISAESAMTAADLLTLADAAMYRAKAGGRDRASR